MRKRRLWRRALLPGAAVAALAALSPPPAAADLCGGCTITYSFNASTCTVTRKADCGTSVCLTIPGLATNGCRKIHTSSQSGVTATSSTGQAVVQSCTGSPATCNGTTTTCDITYLKPALKPVTTDMPAIGTLSTTDKEGTETLTYSSVYTGTEILYRVTNSGVRAYQVVWQGTPFDGDFLAPGDSVTRAVVADVAPVAAFRPIQFVDLDRGGVVLTEAVTYLPSAEVPEGTVEQQKIR